jgi:hypothetical protein
VTTGAAFTFGNIVQSIVGQPVTLPVRVNTGNLAGVDVPRVDLTFTFPEKYLAFTGFAAPSAPGWNFVPNTAALGTLVVTCTHDPGVELSNGAFVSPVFDVFLTADSAITVLMQASTPVSCIVPTGDAGTVKVTQVCFSAGRIIKVGSSPFSLDPPKPNPSNGIATVTYSTGITLSTSFELVDNMGNVVYTFDTAVNPSGTYELQVDSSVLPAGVYYLRMQSGPYVAVQPLSVVK